MSTDSSYGQGRGHTAGHSNHRTKLTSGESRKACAWLMDAPHWMMTVLNQVKFSLDLSYSTAMFPFNMWFLIGHNRHKWCKMGPDPGSHHTAPIVNLRGKTGLRPDVLNPLRRHTGSENDCWTSRSSGEASDSIDTNEVEVMVASSIVQWLIEPCPLPLPQTRSFKRVRSSQRLRHAGSLSKFA
ncbi:unnamed protein product [Natator depressus]